MEHLRRRDDWVNLLQKVSLVLFPLNPVLDRIEKRLCMERELRDETVLRFTQAPKAYASCRLSTSGAFHAAGKNVAGIAGMGAAVGIGKSCASHSSTIQCFPGPWSGKIGGGFTGAWVTRRRGKSVPLPANCFFYVFASVGKRIG